MTDKWGYGEDIQADRLNDHLDATDELRQRLTDLEEDLQALRHAPSTPLWIRITGESSGAYDWEQITRKVDDTGWELLSNGLTSLSTSTNTKAHTWREHNNMLTSTPYTMGICFPTVTNSGTMKYPFIPLGTAEDPTDYTLAGEHALSADSNDWNQVSGISGKDGVSLTRVTGINYDSYSGALYYYIRDDTYDSHGTLLSTTAETEVEANPGL